MDAHDLLTGSSQNFFVAVFAASFAAFGLIGAFDILQQVRAFQQRANDAEIRGLRSTMLLASLNMASAILPLALAEWDHFLTYCNSFLFVASIALFSLVLSEIITGKTVVHFKRITYPVLCLIPMWIILVALNLCHFRSIILYKIVLLWLLFILFLRLVLFLFHLSQLHSGGRMET